MERTRLPPSVSLMRRFAFPRKLGIMDALFGDSLKRHGIGWAECSNGITWKLNLADITHRWIIYGMYEGGLGIEWATKALSMA